MATRSSNFFPQIQILSDTNSSQIRFNLVSFSNTMNSSYLNFAIWFPDHGFDS